MTLIHKMKDGRSHSAPGSSEQWAIGKVGFSGKGPRCSRCGTCDCPAEVWNSGVHMYIEDCPGLEFFYSKVTEPTSRSLCEGCGKKEGLVIVECVC